MLWVVSLRIYKAEIMILALTNQEKSEGRKLCLDLYSNQETLKIQVVLLTASCKVLAG